MEAGGSRQHVIERERRFAQPVAISGFLAAAFLIAGVVAQLQIPQHSNLSDQVVEFSVHNQTIVVSGVLVAAGFVFAIAPIVYLFLAAAARSSRVRAAFVGLCVIGPLLFGAQSIAASVALKSSGDDYLAKRGTLMQRNISVLNKAIASAPKSINQVTLYNSDTPQNRAEVQLETNAFYYVSFPKGKEMALKASLDGASISNSEDSGGKPGDAFANYLQVNSASFKLAGYLAFPAGILLIFSLVYSALQAYRVGLITRLFSTLGAIAAASLFLRLPPALIGLWVSWLGLIYMNRTPGGRPPAWDAGVAVPWPRPGQTAPADAPIEATARPLDPDAPVANPPRQRGERRKRKSRG